MTFNVNLSNSNLKFGNIQTNILLTIARYTLTADINFEGKVNATQTITHEAHIIATVFSDQIFKSNAPPVVMDNTQVSLGLFTIFRPSYVWRRIS